MSIRYAALHTADCCEGENQRVRCLPYLLQLMELSGLFLEIRGFCGIIIIALIRSGSGGAKTSRNEERASSSLRTPSRSNDPPPAGRCRPSSHDVRVLHAGSSESANVVLFITRISRSAAAVRCAAGGLHKEQVR